MITLPFLTALSPVKHLESNINMASIHAISVAIKRATDSRAESNWSKAKTKGPQVRDNNSFIDYSPLCYVKTSTHMHLAQPLTHYVRLFYINCRLQAVNCD